MGLFGRKDKKVNDPTAVDAPVPPSAQNDVVNLPGDSEDEPKVEQLAQTATTATQDIVYPEGVRLALLLLAVFVSMFLVSLDRLIISTAIPQITDDFHSVTDIGWYGSAYLLTNCAFQLLFGKLYTFWSIKTVFLTAVLLFEVGSAICGAAPNSTAFIIGRAVAGLGSAGIMSGAIVTIVYAVPLHKRPLYQGLFGAVFGISSIIGPLLGGAFTTRVSWRWCFYINLPFGGIAMLVIIWVMSIPERDTTKLPLVKKVAQLDIVGTGLLMPGVVCLLLALQWGGLTYAWNSARMIALLTLGGVLLVGFIIVQVLRPDTATVPPRIFLQRSILAGFYSTLCIGSQMMIFVYFLPIWFQAIKGVDAVDSGIRLLPMVLPMVISSIFSGALIARIGYYTPFMLFGVCLMCVGSGLLTTLQVDTGEAQWIGYQLLWGFGMGFTFQAPNLAAQTVLPNKDVPIGTSLMFFSQLLGGAIFISVGQNVLDNQLLERLAPLGFGPAFIENTGATSLTSELPANLVQPVLFQYNEALRHVFQVGLIMTCLTIFGALALEWRSVKKNQPKKATDAEGGDAAAAGADGKVAGAETGDETEKETAAAPQREAALDEKRAEAGDVPEQAPAAAETSDLRRPESGTTAHDDHTEAEPAPVAASADKETTA